MSCRGCSAVAPTTQLSTLRGKVTSQTPVCPDPTRVAVIPPVWLVIVQESPFGTSAASTLSAVPAVATWSLPAFLLMIFLTCFFSCPVRELAARPVPTNAKQSATTATIIAADGRRTRSFLIHDSLHRVEAPSPPLLVVLRRSLRNASPY